MIYLATSEKSNSAYNAINKALAFVKQTGDLPVPLHLRNAPTELMSSLGYGEGYLYPHDFPGHYVQQDYLPEQIRYQRFWYPDEHVPAEARLLARLSALKKQE